MQKKYFRSYSAPQNSLNSHGKQYKRKLSQHLANRQLGVVWGLLFLTAVADYAVFIGGTVTTELTPTRVRVEVVGKPR